MSQSATVREDPLVFEVLYEPLEPIVEEEAQKCRENDQPKKLFLQPFVRNLVYGFVMGLESLGLLVTHVRTSEHTAPLGLLPVGKSTYHEAFARFPAATFRKMFTLLLGSIGWLAVPEMEALGRLYLVDSSLFPALLHMAWATYTSQHHAFRLHLCFDLNRMIPVQVLLQEGTSNEKIALKTWLEAGVTYIADRGYISFTLFADIVKAGAFFVIRQKSNLQYQVVQALSVTLPAGQNLFSSLTDQRVRLTNDDSGHIYRLICFQVGATRFLLLTNRLDLTTFQVILLYAYRWQIELIFRFLKCTLTGLHFLNYSANGVQIQFYVLLMTALLELHFKQRCLPPLPETAMPEELAPPAPATATSAEPPPPTPATATSAEPPPPTPETVPSDPTAARGSQPAPDRAKALDGRLIRALSFASPSQFLRTLGRKMRRYWKIGRHWLEVLRNRIASPLDQRTRALLNAYT
jgi:hypothetical protein